MKESLQYMHARVCVHALVCLCVCMCMHVHVHVCVHMCVYGSVYMYTGMCVCVCAHAHESVCMCVNKTENSILSEANKVMKIVETWEGEGV